MKSDFVPAPQHETRPVNCNGCRICCIGEAVILHPEHGDDPARYQVIPFKHPLSGKPVLMLAHKPNGECVYLGTTGCTIYGDRPVICRTYDCAAHYASLTRADRKRLIKAGLADKDRFDIGRQKLAEKECEERLAREKGLI